jgi:hypothetical protein
MSEPRPQQGTHSEKNVGPCASSPHRRCRPAMNARSSWCKRGCPVPHATGLLTIQRRNPLSSFDITFTPDSARTHDPNQSSQHSTQASELLPHCCLATSQLHIKHQYVRTHYRRWQTADHRRWTGGRKVHLKHNGRLARRFDRHLALDPHIVLSHSLEVSPGGRQAIRAP